MHGVSTEEEKAISRASCPSFCEMEWAERVKRLSKGTRVLKLSASSKIQGAEWKRIRLRAPQSLAEDPTLSDPSSLEGAVVSWPSLLRRRTRNLPLSSITGIHVGADGRLWCPVVPTEWHYMTLTTADRSYAFGFESAETLLLWVNTLQRVCDPDWTRRCASGDKAALFKGAVSESQHLYYRYNKIGSDDDALVELCPVLYPLSAKLAETCANLGVSFSANSESARRSCVWTAVAVLEAPTDYQTALERMRGVLTELGFYSKGESTPDAAGFYDEGGLAHTLAKDSLVSPTPTDRYATKKEDADYFFVQAQHASTGKCRCITIKKDTKLASIFEAHILTTTTVSSSSTSSSYSSKRLSL